MQSALLYPFIVLAGILQACGVPMNAQLRVSLSNPWLASVVSFGPILAFFLCAFAVMPKPLPTIEGISNMPWWAPLGGLAGAVAVFLGLTIVDKIGAGPFAGLLITANIIASVAIDHFGFLNMPVHHANPMRLLGTALLVGGVVLISKF